MCTGSNRTSRTVRSPLGAIRSLSFIRLLSVDHTVSWRELHDLQEISCQALTHKPQLRGFVETMLETMLAEDTVSEIEHLLPGYAVWNCVRPRPSRGRPHGGISLFVRRDSVWHTSTGFKVVSDPAAGILWVEIPRFKLTVAICYFSPHGSQVYQLDHMHPDPLSVWFAGLRKADAKGHQHHLVMGDLNIKVGGLSIDVPSQLAIPPALAEPSPLPDLHHLAAIPQQRRSLDRGVPNRQRALAFLEGLFALSSVVLNGRAPGDVEGGHTCWSWSANDQLLGHSVVDYACVSVSLFQAVSVFEVLPFIPTASKDHSALYVSLSGMQPCYSTLRPRRQRVLRPQGSGYPSALSGSQGRFADLLDAGQAAAVPVSTALQQYIDLLVSCSEGHGGADTSTPAHTRDKPWFDS
jgi:hypothetical protein